MKYIGIILLAWLGIQNQAGQDLYACRNVKIGLFSSAPIEDIKASTSSGTSVYNAATGDIAFSVAISSFQFRKSRMQEHFNENYMESDKYPRASFKGKVQEHVDVTRNGTYPITVNGNLDVHGVSQPRTIQGTLTVANGTLNMASEFMVKCVDHKIEIPRLVFKNIAESIKLNVWATYTATSKPNFNNKLP